MGCLVVLLLLVLLAAAGVWITAGIVGLLFTLLIAGLIGWAADQLVPGGRLPGGWLGAVLTGVLGAFLGHALFALLRFGHVGPVLFGVEVLPAFVGAVIVALAAQLFTRSGRYQSWT
jgi:uncharacterized membrane protein YeaQ/YmgE (transglycosylase-associated protein family)